MNRSKWVRRLLSIGDTALCLLAGFLFACDCGICGAALRGATMGTAAFGRAIRPSTVAVITVLVAAVLYLLVLFGCTRRLPAAVLTVSLFMLASLQLATAFSAPLYVLYCVLLFVCCLIFVTCPRGTKKSSAALSLPPMPGENSRLWWMLPAFALAIFLLLAGVVSVMRVLSYTSPSFDFGIFNQMFHSMRTDFSQMTTCERNYPLSHFAVHASPIYYLLLPLYALFPSPITLAVSQVLVAACAAVPMALLARRVGHSRRGVAVLVAMLLLLPTLSGGCMYDMHENCFLTVFLLFLFYFAEARRPLPIFLFATLTMLVKEDAPVYVAFAALYLLLSAHRLPDKKMRQRTVLFGGLLFLYAVFYFLLVTSLLKTYGLGIMASRYGNLSDNGSLTGVLLTAFKNPAALLAACVDNGEKLAFFAQIMLPLAALPLLTRKWERLVLFGPAILINFLPDYGYQYQIFFQYHFGVCAFLLYAAALNLYDLKDVWRRRLPAFALLCALLLLIGVMPPKLAYIDKYTTSAKQFEAVTEVLDTIPQSASVSASTCYCTALAQRETLYVLDKYECAYDTDYIVLDIRYQNGQKHYNEYILNPAYELSDYVQNYIAVFKRLPPS